MSVPFVHFATVLTEELQQIRRRREAASSSRSPESKEKNPDPAGVGAGPRNDQPPARDPQREAGRFPEERAPAAAPPGGAQAEGDQPRERDPQRAVQLEALEYNLFGLAFSGGGIRSATFNLGVLQRLASAGLLKHVDYLSTVSGGGYIGSWLAAWIAREGEVQVSPGQEIRPAEPHRCSVRNVERQLPPSRVTQSSAYRTSVAQGEIANAVTGAQFEPEPEPVRHLRSYSNYLAPRLGFFSADSWTLIAIYLRNLLLNQALLLFVAMFVVTVMRLVVLFYSGWGPVGAATRLEHAPFFVSAAFCVCLGAALFAVTRELTFLEGDDESIQKKRIRVNSEWMLQTRVGLPLLVAAACVTWLLSTDQLRGRLDTWLVWILSWQVPGVGDWLAGLFPQNAQWRNGVLFGLPFGIINGGFNLFGCFAYRNYSGSFGKRKIVSIFLATAASGLVGFSAGAVGGLLLYVVSAYVLLPLGGGAHSPAVITTVGPPLMLLVFVASAYVEVGLSGTMLNLTQREWWSRICGWCLIYALVWLVTFGVPLLGLKGMEWLWDLGTSWAKSAGGGAIVTWLLTTLTGAWAGSSSRTRDGRGGSLLELFGTIAPYVFISGLAIFVSWIVSTIVRPDVLPAVAAQASSFWDDLNAPRLETILGLAAGTAAGAGLLIWRLDANVFSLNALYASRLIRCYLGASRKMPHWTTLGGENPYRGGAPTNSKDPVRDENPITGLDPADDVPLRELQVGTDLKGKKLRTLPVYWGPFPIINTALNLVAGAELAWQERKAESFVLTPLYCGSHSTGYAKLLENTEADKLTLGRAISISGAAASPNMGYHSSPALSALMTVFNVRLGWWLRNPRNEGWAAQSAGLGWFLIKELLGQTNEKGREVYLSDGGHFENLGVYELIRRRCRFIIACDAGADPELKFEDLGSLIRKCRTDFGVRIDIDVSPIRRNESTGRSRWHCAVGRIQYQDVHRKDAEPNAAEKAERADEAEKTEKPAKGIILYIKASLTGDEPSDVLDYARRESSFPHEPTSDQFFDECQFESYRALGDHIMKEVLGESHGRFCERDSFGPPDGQPLPNDDQQVQKAREVAGNGLSDLFDRWENEWSGLLYDIEEKLARSAEGYLALHETLRSEKGLRNVGRQLYGKTYSALSPRQASNSINEFHFICQVLQVMENAWLELDLDQRPDHPLKIGWSKLIQRWAKTEIVEKYWEDLQGEFSVGFVRFIKRIRKMDLKEPD